MKIVLVAGDFAQSEVLKMLGDKLKEIGHEISSLLSYGRSDQFSSHYVYEKIKDADCLISGMSELANQEVVAVEGALGRGMKVVLYADTFLAHRLPSFEFASLCKLIIFAINDIEAADAHELFPYATIKVTGNPNWEDFAFPKLSREESRKVLGVADKKRVIISLGDKFLSQNIIQFGATIDAVRKLDWEESTEILLALHPGDLNDPKLYDDLVSRAGCSVKIIGRHLGINTGEILPGCDLVVEFTSTIGIQAACLRIPVIDFCSTVALRGRKPMTNKDPWRLVECGASIPVYYGSSDALANVMIYLEKPMARQLLQESQERMFPVPTPESRGQAIRLMCEALGA